MPLDKIRSAIKAIPKLEFLAIVKRHLTAIAFSLIILSACSSNSSVAIDTSGLIDVADITQNAESYLGKTVLVRNDVIKSIGNKGLVLDKDRAFGGETILVINIAPMPSIFFNDRTPEVLVSGIVERLNLTAIEQQYGLKLDRNLYNQYETKPVIIAQSLLLSPDPEDLTNNPEVYYGKPLAIEGELEDLTPYGIFELDEEQVFGGEDLLVVQPNPRIELNEEKNALVYGKLRPFVIVELERDYDLGWDLSIETQIEAEYEQKAIFVAEKIQILE
jgi:hypothetical protein